ncbi:MAG: hypothetical protein WDO18_21025 [Acidobacteriota bacterium]
MQSEAFGEPEWDNGLLTAVTTGQADPWGGTRASMVTGAPAEIAQVLAVPGDFRYSLSVWARSAAGASATLFAETTGGSAEHTVVLGSAWSRISMVVDLGLATESVKFGVRLTDTAFVVGMQVEAQIGAGDYQKNGRRGRRPCVRAVR